MCRRMVCDCDNPNADLFCCPECDPRLSSQCLHQNGLLTYGSGDTWVENCQQCQCLVRHTYTHTQTGSHTQTRSGKLHGRNVSILRAETTCIHRRAYTRDRTNAAVSMEMLLNERCAPPERKSQGEKFLWRKRKREGE